MGFAESGRHRPRCLLVRKRLRIDQLQLLRRDRLRAVEVAVLMVHKRSVGWQVSRQIHVEVERYLPDIDGRNAAPCPISTNHFASHPFRAKKTPSHSGTSLPAIPGAVLFLRQSSPCRRIDSRFVASVTWNNTNPIAHSLH